MASRMYQQFSFGLEKYPVTLYANIPIGASGAVGTLNPQYNQGISSVTRSSAGVYVINFGIAAQGQVDKYKRLLATTATLLDASVAGVRMEVVADNTATGSVTVRFVAATSTSVTTPVVTDPPSGAVLLLSFVLKNSDV